MNCWVWILLGAADAHDELSPYAVPGDTLWLAQLNLHK